MRVFRNHRTAIAAVSVAFILLISGCDEFLLSDLFYRPTGLPLEIRPTAAVVRTGETAVFVGLGGTPAYTFRVNEPGGGEIDPVTGFYTAPDSTGLFTVELTDHLGERAIAVVYSYRSAPLTISPQNATMPAGATRQYSASGGTGRYAFTVDDVTVGTIDAESGLFAASESEEGTTSVRLSDGESVASASVTVEDVHELGIFAETDAIAQGQSVTMTVVGGSGAYLSFVRLTEPGWHYDGSDGGSVDWPLPNNRAMYRAGEAIGVARFRVTDSDAALAEIDVMVNPAAPSQFYAVRLQGPPRVRLRWQHERPGSERFEIWRSEAMHDGYAYHETVVADGGPAYEIIDDKIGPNEPVFYRIRAAAGDGFESEWVQTHP